MNDFVGSPPLFGEAPSLPQQIRANFLEPQEQDPKKSRELKTLQAAGVDPSLDVEKAKARFLADTFSNTNWVQRHPTLAAKLADRNYVQIARDDVGNIIETEGLVNEMANAWRVSRDTVFAGKIGTRAMLEVRDLHPYERERLKRAQELASAYMASDPGFIASSVELAGTLVETAGVSAVAGGVTGAVFPPAAPYVAGAAAYAASFQLEGGNLYAELLREFQGSITPAEARDIAIGYGSVIAGADLIGLKVATAPIKGLIKEIAKKRGKGLLTREAASRMTLRIVGQGLGGAVGEATTEGVQDVLQERAKRIASELYRPDNLYEPEYEESFWRAFNHTFKGMVLMAGVPTGVRVVNTNIKVANANYDYEQAKKAAEIRGRSKAPEAQREVEAEAGESDTLNSTYYVRAQDFNKAISELAEQTDVTEQQVRDTVEANSPGLMARIDEAAERDGEVELTKSEWGAAFDNTKFRDTALLNTAFEEDGLTQREAKEVDLIRDKVVKEEGEAAAKKLQELEAFERELREVRKEMRQQLDVVLKGTDAAQTMNAAANAAVLMGFIRRGALQMNISPREFVEKHLPQIVQQRLTGQEAAQAQQQQQAQQQTEQQAETLETFAQDLPETPEEQRARMERMLDAREKADEEMRARGQTVRSKVPGETESPPTRPMTTDDITTVEQADQLLEELATRRANDIEQASGVQVAEFDRDRARIEARRAQLAGEQQTEQQTEQQAQTDTLESGTFDQDADYTFTEGDYRPEVVAWAKEQFGDRVAPNGKPVYQNFVRWFGDSKVVDAEGKPLVVYHATTAEFSKFDRQAEGSMFTYGREPGSGGIFFSSTPSPYFTEGSRGQEKGGRTIPAYVTIKNPAIVTRGLSLEEQAKALREAEEQGHDGAIIGEVEYVAFNPNQIKSTLQGRSDEYGDFSADPRILYSKEGDKKVLGTASFEGTDAIQKILLDPDAKPTTLMHELMHWNLELMATIGLDIEGKLAQEGYEATALERQMLDDIQRLLKWSGFEGTLTEWRAMTTDQRRPFHEAVAVSFETYLYEGVAPSRELRGVFRRLLSYIAGKFEELVKGFQKDYEQEFGRPLPGLTDEVRAIFGRMMSAERDVQAFFDESELDAMMMTKKEWTDSGRDADEYDEYEREFKDALTEATAELTIQRMKEVKTFANAYALVAQKQRGELQRISKEIRQEVQAQVEVESVYQFVSWMRKGTYQSENGTVEPVNLPSAEGTKTSRKLNAAIVKAVAPDLYDKLARRGLVSKNGVTLEKVRGMFGFESNRAMLEALATHRNIKEEVLHRTNQRLLNEHTSLMDPIVQQENIHAAVHNKIRQRVVARELKFLLQNGRRSKQELELAKRIAEALIEKTPVGNIDIVAYKRAAARARKKALKALKDGDMEAAAFAKRQELVNEQMIVEGLKARKEVRSLIESNKRAFKHRTDKALASAGYDVTVMKALRAVLARLGIGNVDFDANEALARFVKEDPEFAAEVSGNIASLLGKDIAQPRVGDRRKPMEHLTLGDIRVLRLLSARMMLRAKNKLKTKIGEKRQRVEAAQDEAASTLDSNVKDGSKDLDGKKSIFGKIRNYFSDLIRFEHLFRRADGGKVGIWTQMFRMVKDAGNRYRQEFKEFAEDFGNRLRALDLTIPGGARELELTVYGNRVVIGENGRNVKSQLIHLAMHYYGNASNRQRLLRGYIGQDIDPELLDEAMEQADLEVKTFLQEQIRQGLLTRKDFEFMQETFKQLSGANMLGRAQQVMMRLRHYEMDTIEGEKFSVQFPDGETVEFMGGYIPIRYDTSTASVRESDAPGLQDEDMSIEQQATRMLGILPSFTKDRTGPAALPLELNLANIQHHAAEVFKFIHMAEPVTEVYKVVSGRKVRQTFIRKFGTKAYRNMEGWLRRSAYQKFDKSEDTEVGDMMLTLARNANMGIMFLNIGNALQNYAGLIIPMRRVGARRIISALMSNMFSNGPRAEVAEKSVEMRIRLDRQIFDIYNQQQKLLTQESGVWDRIQDWSNRYAYFLQQWTQNHVDVAVWQAAYNQETEVALREMIGQPDAEAKAEARAVAYADSIVRQTQMAGEKEDLSNFESQGSIYRAMFPFKSWFINWMNNASNQRRLDMDKKGQAKAAALASSYMYLLMLPAMMATAAVEIARGEDFDDDDDGYGDDMWELWWRSQAEQITGGLPVIQEATRVMDTFWFDDEYWNNRYPATPWQRVIENIAKAPLKDDTVDAAGSLVSQIADLMGIPASRVWKSVNLLGDEFIRDDLESESTYDFIRGAVTGQRSDLQRLSQ